MVVRGRRRHCCRRLYSAEEEQELLFLWCWAVAVSLVACCLCLHGCRVVMLVLVTGKAQAE